MAIFASSRLAQSRREDKTWAPSIVQYAAVSACSTIQQARVDKGQHLKHERLSSREDIKDFTRHLTKALKMQQVFVVVFFQDCGLLGILWLFSRTMVTRLHFGGMGFACYTRFSAFPRRPSARLCLLNISYSAQSTNALVGLRKVFGNAHQLMQAELENCPARGKMHLYECN